VFKRWIGLCVLAGLAAPGALALDPRKSLTQYSRRSWGQKDGLPQDTVRAIAQTTDGYLWLGTDEGLARFDGYEFTVFDKSKGDLPANSITVLSAAPDGSLWIGTPGGLAQYRDKHFRTYTTRDGLPDNAVTSVYSDHLGTLWLVAGGSLVDFTGGKFRTYSPERTFPVTSLRVVHEDQHHDLLAAGYSGVVRVAGGKPAALIDESTLAGSLVSALLVDRHNNLWVGGSLGLIERTAAGRVRKFSQADGLPDVFVRAVWEDRDGNLWIGTNAGLARLEGERFVTPAGKNAAPTSESDLVRCLFEDGEGDLWVGANNGLTRLRDDAFTVYGKPEGLPSDEPNVAYQDRAGRVWVGFHEGGLVFATGHSREFTRQAGTPDTEIFSIRETAAGDLLMGTRSGLVRMHGGTFTTVVPPDALSRRVVFDALEDPSGTIWMAAPGGLFAMHERIMRAVIPGGPLTASAMVTLCQGRDGVIWAGSNAKGLWRIAGDDVRNFTTANGLSNDNIREIYQDAEGTLWIGTFGGGLNALRDGHFYWFTQKDGLLSDNVSNIADDGESLWLSTTRGICRIAKRQLWEFASSQRKRLAPVNYGIEDGLRSAQCSPGYPTGGGGTHFADGRLWFPTSRGLAVYDPREPKPPAVPPAIHLSEIDADSHPLDLTRPARLSPGVERLRVRYSAIHLSAPERVEYAYKLEGLEPDWISPGKIRETNFNSLKHGPYRFIVRAQVPGGLSAEQTYSFDVLPHYYETAWFRVLCVALAGALVWGAYQMRLRQIRYRFALVLGERARLAREIHDTLAQGFVGISSQLDAVAMCLPDEQSPVRKYLDLARRMARHSLTEARRSVMDLRASVLEGQDLAAALQSGTRMWTAGSPVAVEVDVSGPPMELPQEMEQHLLRIAQEAVTNVLKHAGASRIAIKLHTEARKLYLRIRDNGRGFEQGDVFVSAGGHFGVLGMRERAQRLGGELRLNSHPGEGTEVEVTVPLP
jgi:signal transduction histidine kinase/ligand-binding sensor domain-containing protein